MGREPSKKHVRKVGAVVCGAAVLLGALVWALASGDTHVEQYNAMAAAHQKRAQTRVGLMAGQAPLEGDSGTFYKAAHDLCLPGADHPEVRASLNAALKASPGTPPQSAAPQPCQQLGIAADDPVGQHLTAQTCRWLTGCQGAVDKLLRGTRALNPTNPLSIWDPWRCTPTPHKPDPQRLKDLALATLIRAPISAPQGQLRQALQEQLAVVRLGTDLGHNAGLNHTRTAHQIIDAALHALRTLAKDPRLTAQDLKDALDALRHLDTATALPRVATYQSDALLSLSERFKEDDPIPRPPCANPPKDLGFIWRTVANNALGTAMAFWRDTIQTAQDHPLYDTRAPALGALLDKTLQSANPLIVHSLPKLVAHEHTLSAIDERSRMTQIILTLEHQKRLTGSLPAELVTPPKSVLTDAPWTFKQDPFELSSPALERSFDTKGFKDAKDSLTLR